MEIKFVGYEEINMSGHDMILLKGIKTYDNSEWEKRYFPNMTEIHDVVTSASPGDVMDLTFITKGKFKNLSSVVIKGKGGGGGASKPASKSQSMSKGDVPVSNVPMVIPNPDDVINGMALTQSIAIMGHMLQFVPGFAKGMKEVDCLNQTVETASVYAKFIKGQTGTTDAKAADGQPEPPPVGDDDIPF